MSSEKKITSLKKILANRNNAKKSTGPRTEKGKVWSRRNSVKHGLLAENIVTIGENKQAFEEFNQQMIKELKPIDLFSMQMVNKIIQTAWNLKRCDQIQSGMHAYEIQSYEADEYKSNLKAVHHPDFAKEDEKSVRYQNLLLGLSFLRDCNSGNALIKLGSYESKLLHRFFKLREELKSYKEEQYG